MSLKSYLSPQAYSAAQAERTKRFLNRVTPAPYAGDDPVEFINREMVIPETGKPLILHEEQAAVLRTMAHKTDGNYDYAMWLYSAPKKSGKTTIGAAVALWQAMQVPDGQVYIIGNDLKQADNRMMEAIRYAITHNPRFTRRARIIRNTIYLENGTKLESIPVDPKGEAGMNPTGLFWTEAWGAMGNKPELLWSEAVLSPTRAGKSFKFVESYAGFEGQSLILERLYRNVIKDGIPHETIPELFTKNESIGYWCTRRYMPWQISNPKYYVNEEADKTPQEYERVHGNKWSSSSEAFIPIAWWDACRVENMTPYDGRGIVIALDAAAKDDCFAVVALSKSREDKPQVRYCRVWYPPKGGEIKFSEIEDELKKLFKDFNVTEVTYDETQMVSMAQRLGDLAFWKAFPQGKDRLIADKRLYDMIRDRQIEHSGESDLKQHMQNADRKPDEDKLRIIKRNAHDKIDGCVALSMGVERIMYYNL